MKKILFLVLLLPFVLQVYAQQKDTICYHYYANNHVENGIRQPDMEDVILVFVYNGTSTSCYYYGTSDAFCDTREGWLPGFVTLKATNLVISKDKFSFTLDANGIYFYSQPVELDLQNRADILKTGYHSWVQAAANCWNKTLIEGNFSSDSLTLVNKTFLPDFPMTFHKETFEYVKSVYKKDLISSKDEYENRAFDER